MTLKHFLLSMKNGTCHAPEQNDRLLEGHGEGGGVQDFGTSPMVYILIQ